MLDVVLLIVCFILFIWVLFLSKSEKSFFVTMLWAFVYRLALLFLDYYHVISLPGSGADSEEFHRLAVENLYSSELEHYTNYEVFLTGLYALTDCSRLFAQYLNVIMGMLTLLWINKTMQIIDIDRRYRLQCVKILAILPNFAIFSAILLREAWVEMFVIMSIFYFVKWFKKKRGFYDIGISFACVIAATWMHVGCVALLIGYMICILLYDRNTMCVHFSRYSIAALGVLSLLLIFLLVYAESLFAKLGRFSDLSYGEIMETLVDIQDYSDAGSVYLTWLSYSNPIHLVLYVPLKMFYFMYSPIPFDWRNMMDVIAFLMDSSVYIFLSYNIIKSPIKKGENKYLRCFLIISFLFATFMLSMGTTAAGTAIRHRAKIVSVLVVCYGISMTYGGRMAPNAKRVN